MGHISKSNICDHCQLDVVVAHYINNRDELVFCCHGCKNVYQILEQQNLTEYYQIKKNGENIRANAPALIAQKKESFIHFNQRQFLEDYALTNQQSTQMRFYLEGVHCLACLWLIENINQVEQFQNKILYSRLDLSKSVVDIKFTSDIEPSTIASQFASWGYRPHPISLSQKKSGQNQLDELQKKEDRKMLTRIGVAAFSAGNIMIYAVSLYGGADGQMASFFGVITLLLALPVFFLQRHSLLPISNRLFVLMANFHRPSHCIRPNCRRNPWSDQCLKGRSSQLL